MSVLLCHHKTHLKQIIDHCLSNFMMIILYCFREMILLIDNVGYNYNLFDVHYHKFDYFIKKNNNFGEDCGFSFEDKLDLD